MSEYQTGLLDFRESDKPLLGGPVADNELCLQSRLNEFTFQVRASEVTGRTYDISTELLVMHESEPGVVARLFLMDLLNTIAAAQAVAEDITGKDEPQGKIKFADPFSVYSVEYEDDLVVRDSVDLHSTGVGCKITAYPDGSARLFMYDKHGPCQWKGSCEAFRWEDESLRACGRKDKRIMSLKKNRDDEPKPDSFGEPNYPTVFRIPEDGPLTVLTDTDRFNILSRFGPSKEEYESLSPDQRWSADVELGSTLRKALAEQGLRLSDFQSLEEFLDAVSSLKA